MQRKNGFFLFILSCIPGCGQMYQGYMKRGVSLLGAGCLVIVLASMLSIGELGALLPVVWLYAFFDSYNLRNQTEQQWYETQDGFLFGLEELTGEKLTRICSERHSFIGWLLVAIGAYSLYKTVLGQFMYNLAEAYNLWWLYDLTVHQLPRILVTVVIILLGVWFIRGPRKEAEEDAEDYRSFTPPPAPPVTPPPTSPFAPPPPSPFAPPPPSPFVAPPESSEVQDQQ